MTSSQRGFTGGSGRRVLLALVGGVALIAATACSALGGSTSNSNSPNPDNLEKPTIKVGAISAASSAPLYIALQKGYFKQEGLTVKPVVTTGGSQAIPQLIAGDLDVTLTNPMTAIAAVAKKTADLKFVFDGVEAVNGTYTVDALPGSGIKSIRDLVGKTVAISSPNDIVALSLEELCKANDVDINSIHFITIPYANTEQALKTHQADAATQTEPYTTESERNDGVVPVVDVFAQGGPTFQLPNASYVSTSKFAAANPKTIAAFQRAMAKGAADAANRSNVEQILPTYTKIDPSTSKLISLPTFPTSLDATRYQRVVTLMQQFGKIKGNFDIKTMIVPTANN